MNSESSEVTKIVRCSLYLGRELRKASKNKRNGQLIEQVRGVLQEARAMILLKPSSHVKCIALIPHINAFLRDRIDYCQAA